MKPLAHGLGAAVAAFLLFASPAVAEEPGEALIPPENSAVNQYTEAFPTAGGEKDVHRNKGGNRSPKKVLGERNARKLAQHGAEGRAVAEVVVETAPVIEKTTAPSRDDSSGEAGGAIGKGGSGGRGSNGAAGDAPPAGKDRPPATANSPNATDPSGSSGIGEVIASATGSSSSDGMGILLPLLIVATILWAFAYLARQRKTVS